MPSSPLRLAATAVTAALTIASVGFVWETARFGFDRSSRSRIEQGVRDEFEARVRALDALAEGVTHQSALIANATDQDRDGLPALFSTLGDLSTEMGAGTMSATLYTSTGARGPHDILAWTDGPVVDPPPDRLDGPSSLFFQPGALGLLLVSVRPVEAAGRRLGTAVAETVFAPPAPAGGPGSYQMATTFGPVRLIFPFSDQERANEPGAFTLTHNGTPLADVQFSPDEVNASRSHFRDEWIAAAALPLAAVLLLAAGRLVARRRSTPAAMFLTWSVLGAALVAASTAGLVALERLLAIARSGQDATMGLGASAVVVIVAVSWWWRRLRRRHSAHTPVRFALEQAAAGLGLAALIVALARAIGAQGRRCAHLNAWQFPDLSGRDGQSALPVGSAPAPDLRVRRRRVFACHDGGTVAPRLAPSRARTRGRGSVARAPRRGGHRAEPAPAVAVVGALASGDRGRGLCLGRDDVPPLLPSAGHSGHAPGPDVRCAARAVDHLLSDSLVVRRSGRAIAGRDGDLSSRRRKGRPTSSSPNSIAPELRHRQAAGRPPRGSRWLSPPGRPDHPPGTRVQSVDRDRPCCLPDPRRVSNYIGAGRRLRSIDSP